MRLAAALTVLLFAVLAGAFSTYWALSTGSASSASGLACSVKASCGTGEVAVLRMSSTSNAHAGTPGGSGYSNVVCCGGVTGLGTSCSGTYDTVLRLSAADNAHVQATGSYPTEVCLSASTAVVQCMFAPSCRGGYACLATASATDNAHVADCDGTDDYATKVCCYAGDPIPVGGVAELPDVSGSSGPNHLMLAGLAALALAALTSGAWRVRRWWGR
jgi:hypothetical protein